MIRAPEECQHPTLAHTKRRLPTARGVGVAGGLIVGVGAVPVAVSVVTRRSWGRSGAGADTGSGPQRLVAPMPGKVVRVFGAPGDEVVERQPVVVIEAMKMENELRAARDGALLFVPSDGVGQLITNWQSNPKITEITPPKPANNRRIHLNAGGADFSPDGSLLYWSSGERGSIFVFDTTTGKLQSEISLNVQSFADSYAVDVKLSPDGRYLYCADVTNFRLAVVDTTLRQTISSIRVGRYPYALALAGKTALVTDCYGSGGGIARYNQDLFEALAGPDTSIVILPRYGSPKHETLPAGVTQLPSVADKINYSIAAVLAAFRRRPIDVVFCGHVFMAPLARLVARMLGAPVLAVTATAVTAGPPASRVRQRRVPRRRRAAK